MIPLECTEYLVSKELAAQHEELRKRVEEVEHQRELFRTEMCDIVKDIVRPIVQDIRDLTEKVNLKLWESEQKNLRTAMDAEIKQAEDFAEATLTDVKDTLNRMGNPKWQGVAIDAVAKATRIVTEFVKGTRL